MYMPAMITLTLTLLLTLDSNLEHITCQQSNTAATATLSLLLPTLT
jgi:hypothetical protein